MLACGVVALYGEYRVCVVTRADRLIVRNRFRRYEMAPENIAGFRIGPTGWDPFRESVHVRTRDGQDVELAVTRRTDSIRGRRLRLEKLLDDLTTWKTQVLTGRREGH
ncbi:PH domain-containing protein [Marmoricola sp. URHA0025 HA25]